MMLLAENPQSRGRLLEVIVADVLSQLGYQEVQTRQKKNGEELDITARYTTGKVPESAFAPVIGECKAYGRPVDMPRWNQFIGKVYKRRADDRRTQGILVAISGVTADVRDNFRDFSKTAEGSGISLLDDADLVRLFVSAGIVPSEDKIRAVVHVPLRDRLHRMELAVAPVGDHYRPLWLLSFRDDGTSEAYWAAVDSAGEFLSTGSMHEIERRLSPAFGTRRSIIPTESGYLRVVEEEQDRRAIISLIESGSSESFHQLPATAEPRQLAEAISSLANTRGGTLIIGSPDEGDGISIPAATLSAINVASGPEFCYPPVRLNPPRLYTIGTSSILSVEVPQSPVKVCLLDGRCLIRRGGRIEPHFSLFQDEPVEFAPVPDAAFESDSLLPLSQGKFDAFRKKLGEARPATARLDNATLLNRYGCLRNVAGQQTVTVAGIVMFAAEPQRFLPNTGATLVRFRGTDVSPESDMYDDRQDLEGTAPDLLEASLNFVARNTRQAATTVEGRRLQVPEYPVEAIREVLVNAFVHRDYSKKARVRVFLFDDRIEVISPGRLPPGVTVDGMRNAVMQHAPRNMRIAELMQYCDPGFEGIGQGVRRIIDSLRSAGLADPDFKEEGDAFQVTLWSKESGFTGNTEANPEPNGRLTNVGPRLGSTRNETVSKRSRSIEEATRKTDSIVRAPGSLMDQLVDRARLLARSDVPCLLVGPTGTGKTLLAEHIHRWSGREGPFVVALLTAIPRELLLSELFGHRRGAFTGATGDRPGLFKSADGGSLLLDEIGDVGIDVQAALLRAIDSQEIRPVGSDRMLRLNVRIIAATNRDPAELMTSGGFRHDLYHRLAAAVLRVPPLRERGIGDIAALSVHCLRGMESQVHLSTGAIERLAQYDWPGNVRELYSVLQAIVIEMRPEEITASMVEHALAERLPSKAGSVEEIPLAPLAEIERNYVKKLASATAGNVALMARISGKSASWVRKRLAGMAHDPTSVDDVS